MSVIIGQIARGYGKDPSYGSPFYLCDTSVRLRVFERERGEAIVAQRCAVRASWYVTHLGDKLPAFTFVGSYPIVYYTKSCDELCAECATALLHDAATWDGDLPVEQDVCYEGPTLQCSECLCELESAYGDPDASEADK